ncbi:hydroxymethylpyrimidine/phosphomethylpyrimidine kinase [Moraxella bovis]|nr:bifunctional hydroxymethylpyrimidine kinase/phosphomethylpyrimidine kinase [Moraxella bovis]UYZ91484.1 hydroxymethylpyrimidine/phosphomethylpyrimidine kinase [Moraxella bovis]
MRYVHTHPRTNRPAQALSIAGSDSGGGAGMQADLKTFAIRCVFGTSVLTATTAQNTQGVWGIHHLPTDHIRAQLVAIRDDFEIGACKIGMLGTSDIIDTVGRFLQNRPFRQVVLDPVMIAKGGHALLDDNATDSLKRLIPLTDIITPNLPEAEVLTGMTIACDDDIRQALYALQGMGQRQSSSRADTAKTSKVPYA